MRYLSLIAQGANFKRMEEGETPPSENPASSNKVREKKKDEKIDLDWKDYVAITVALLESILLPIVVFLVLLIIIFVIVVVR